MPILDSPEACPTASPPLRWPPVLCRLRSTCPARRVRDSGADVRGPVAGARPRWGAQAQTDLEIITEAGERILLAAGSVAPKLPLGYHETRSNDQTARL